MPSARTWVFQGNTTFTLFKGISEEPQIKSCPKYSSFGQSRRYEYRNLITAILKILTGGDVYGYINDFLTPKDLATHIFPSNHIISDLVHAVNTWGDVKTKSNMLQFLSP
eukprot:53883_1